MSTTGSAQVHWKVPGRALNGGSPIRLNDRGMEAGATDAASNAPVDLGAERAEAGATEAACSALDTLGAERAEARDTNAVSNAPTDFGADGLEEPILSRPSISAVLATGNEDIDERIAAAAEGRPSGKAPLATFMPMGLLDRIDSLILPEKFKSRLNRLRRVGADVVR